MKGKLKEVWFLALSLASIWDLATNNFTVSGNNYKPPTFIPLNQTACGSSNATQHKLKCDRGEVGVERVNGFCHCSENILHFTILFLYISSTPHGALGWAVQVRPEVTF